MHPERCVHTVQVNRRRGVWESGVELGDQFNVKKQSSYVVNHILRERIVKHVRSCLIFHYSTAPIFSIKQQIDRGGRRGNEKAGMVVQIYWNHENATGQTVRKSKEMNPAVQENRHPLVPSCALFSALLCSLASCLFQAINMETQKRYFFQAVASRSVDKPAQSRGRQERKSQLPTPSHKQQEHVQKKHVLYPLQQLKADKQPTHSIYPIDPINVCPSVPNSPSSARTTHSSPTVETPKVRKPLEPSLPFSPFFPQNIYRSIHPSICCCLPACPATRIPERRTIQPPANTLGK
ncbi:hypothetical protein IWX47DRAFT_482428 [Phyllosticta citricarpa]|uniref:Uncharacterized protein n=1 Tax=Phyllosticta citricarpa TaxID=55181 RepID=A0ABR1LJT8_9PEZI